MSALIGMVGRVRRGTSYVTGAAAALAVIAEALFFRQTVGWTAGLFTVAVALALLFRPSLHASRGARWALVVLVLALGFTMVEEPTQLNIGVAICLMGALAITIRHGWTDRSAVWLRRWTRFILLGWATVLRDANAAARWAMRHPRSPGSGPLFAVRLAGKWVLPLLLGGVFVFLFSLANPVFERWVSAGMNWLSHRAESVPALLNPARIAFWVAVFVGAWSLLRMRARGSQKKRRMHSPPLPSAPQAYRLLPPSRRGLVERCLIVFNAIFALETALDIFYLWGGRQLPSGMTFKEYAHRGAYPLVATALLSAAFVLIAFRNDCDEKSWRTARLLVYAWIAQNVGLTFSAGWRLFLLVNASNLTRLRLATVIWLAVVAAGLLSIIWRIVSRRNNAWLLRANFFIGAAVLYLCCFVNLDGFIADYNADHCLEVARNGDVLGLTYLHELGIEAIPALDRLSQTLDTPQRREMAQDFADDLRELDREELTNWRGWTRRRARLRPTREASALYKTRMAARTSAAAMAPLTSRSGGNGGDALAPRERRTVWR